MCGFRVGVWVGRGRWVVGLGVAMYVEAEEEGSGWRKRSQSSPCELGFEDWAEREVDEGASGEEGEGGESTKPTGGRRADPFDSGADAL